MLMTDQCKWLIDIQHSTNYTFMFVFHVSSLKVYVWPFIFTFPCEQVLSEQLLLFLIYWLPKVGGTVASTGQLQYNTFEQVLEGHSYSINLIDSSPNILSCLTRDPSLSTIPRNFIMSRK